MLVPKGIFVIALIVSNSILLTSNQIVVYGRNDNFFDGKNHFVFSNTQPKSFGIDDEIMIEETCVLYYGEYYAVYMGKFGKFSAINWSYSTSGNRRINAKIMFHSAFESYGHDMHAIRVTELTNLDTRADGLFKVPWRDVWMFVFENLDPDELPTEVTYSIEIISRVGPWMKALFSLLGIGVGLTVILVTIGFVETRKVKKREELLPENNDYHEEEINNEFE